MSAFLDLLTGGGLGILGDVAGATIGAITGKAQQQREQAFNAEQAEIARLWNEQEALKNRQFQRGERIATQNWNLEQWNRENEYNSPEAQMDRMVKAGINPNVAAQSIGGNGAGSSGVVRSTPATGSQAAGSPAATAPSFANTMAELVGNSMDDMWNNGGVIAQTIHQQIQNKNAQRKLDAEIGSLLSNIGLTEAQTKNTEASTGNINADTGYKQAMTEYVKADFTRLVQKTPYEIKAAKLSCQKLLADIDFTNAQTNLAEAQEGLAEAQTGLVGKQGAQIDQNIEESKARMVSMSYQNAKMLAETQKLVSEKLGVDYDNMVKQVDVFLAEQEKAYAEMGIFFDVNDVVGGLIYQMNYAYKLLEVDENFGVDLEDDDPRNDNAYSNAMRAAADNYYDAALRYQSLIMEKQANYDLRNESMITKLRAGEELENQIANGTAFKNFSEGMTGFIPGKGKKK